MKSKRNKERFLLIGLLLGLGPAAVVRADDLGPAREITASRTGDISLTIGVSKTLEFDFEIGPIYLTNGSLFDYRRIQEGDQNRRLILIPKSAGYTDFTIHDAEGNPRVTYKVTVTRERIN